MDSFGVVLMFLLYAGVTIFLTTMIYRLVKAVERIADTLDKN